MLQIGVQTKGLLPEKNPAQAFELIKNAGFDYVDINIDAFLKNTDLYNGNVNKFFDADINDMAVYFGQYKQHMDRLGIKASQMHAPYPIRVEGKPQQNEYMQGVVIPKSIIMAEFLGVPWVIMHPFKMQYYHNKEIERQENIKYFQMLVPLLKQCNVKICFENLYEAVGTRLVEGVCADPREAVWYIDTLNEYAGEELFGFCLDTGHLQLVRRDPYDFITTLGSRIKALHIHENDAVGDLHQLPYSFGSSAEGGQRWERIYKALKEVGYNGVLSFETFPTMNSFPRGMSASVLEAIHSVGVYMAEQIDKA